MKGTNPKATSALTIHRGKGRNHGAVPVAIKGALPSLPAAPKHLPKDVAKHWKGIAGQLHAEGNLTAADLPLVESLAYRMASIAQLEVEVATAPITVMGAAAPIINPVRKLLREELMTVCQLRKELGLAPANRSRMHLLRLQADRMRKPDEAEAMEGDFHHVGAF